MPGIKFHVQIELHSAIHTLKIFFKVQNKQMVLPSASILKIGYSQRFSITN